jgi:hypothetical protein
VLEKANEQTTGFTSKRVPFTIASNGKATVNVPASDTYESTISMYIGAVLQDQVFITDGNWSAMVDPSTSTVSSFKVNNDSKRVIDNKEDFLLFRNVQLEASTPDLVSVYKILRGGGAAQDLTGFKSFQFNAQGTGGTLLVTLVKEGITNWADQYSIAIPLKQGGQDYQLSLNDFVSATSKDKINPNDITAVIFGVGVSTGKLTNVKLDISNASFSKTDFAYLESLKSKELSAYPNPSKGQFVATFNSANVATLTMNVIDASTGRPVFTKSVNAQVGPNSVPVNLDRASGLNTYILTLEGASIKYNSKKILMER